MLPFALTVLLGPIQLATLDRALVDDYGRRVAAALAKPDAGGDAELWDGESFCNRVLAGLNFAVPPAFRAGMLDGTKKPLPVLAELRQAVAAGGRLRYLGAGVRGGEPVARFRLARAEGFTFVEFVVRSRPAAPAVGVDVWTLSNGELSSDAGRRLVAPGLRRYVAGDKSLENDVRLVARLNQLRRDQNAEEWLSEYAKLPVRLQHDKSLMIRRIEMAGMLFPSRSEPLAAALEELGRVYPGDPAAAVTAIDAEFLRGRYADARAAVDRVAASVGDDPIFDTLRAKLFRVEGKLAEARATAARAERAEPDLYEAHTEALEVSISAGEHAETRRRLLLLERRLPGTNVDAIVELPELAKFVASPEYAKWKAERPAPAAR